MSPGVSKRRLISVFGALVAGVLFAAGSAGCGYRLGSALPERIKTIYVKPFVNKTGKLGLEFMITEAVKKQFRVDGTLRVVDSEADADSVLTGEITSSSQAPVVLANDNTTRAYTLTLTTRISFEEAHAGPLKFDNLDTTGACTFYVGQVPAAQLQATRKRSGTREFIAASTLPEAEKNAQPLASDILAENIVSTIVEQGGW